MDPLWRSTAYYFPAWGLRGASSDFPTGDYSPTPRLFTPIGNGDQRERGHPLSRLSMLCAATASAHRARESPRGCRPDCQIARAGDGRGRKNVFLGAALLLECIARLPERNIEREIRRLIREPFSRRLFYRGGFRLSCRSEEH